MFYISLSKISCNEDASWRQKIHPCLTNVKSIDFQSLVIPKKKGEIYPNYLLIKLTVEEHAGPRFFI